LANGGTPTAHTIDAFMKWSNPSKSKSNIRMSPPGRRVGSIPNMA
jgi:hypothetical protein